MSLVYISYTCDPSRGVNANRVIDICRFLSSKKIKTILITPFKADIDLAYITNIVVPPSTRAPSVTENIYNNWIKSLYGLAESKQEEDWVLDLKAYFKSHKEQFLHTKTIYINTHPVCTIDAGIYLKEKIKAKLIVDFQDTFYFNPYKRTLKIFDKLVKSREEKYLKTVDALVVNQLTAKRIYEQNYPNLKVSCIPNIMPLNMPKPYQRSSNVEEKYKIIYGGSLYIGRDLFALLNTLKKVKNKFLVEVMGNFSKINFNRYKNYPEILWNRRIDPKAYFDYLNKSVDIGVVLQSFNTKAEITPIASKTYEYLYLNKAIIYIGPPGDNADLIKKYSNNFYIITSQTEDPGLYTFLENFKNRQDNTKKIFYSEYTPEKIFSPLLQIIKS